MFMEVTCVSVAGCLIAGDCDSRFLTIQRLCHGDIPYILIGMSLYSNCCLLVAYRRNPPFGLVMRIAGSIVAQGRLSIDNVRCKPLSVKRFGVISPTDEGTPSTGRDGLFDCLARFRDGNDTPAVVKIDRRSAVECPRQGAGNAPGIASIPHFPLGYARAYRDVFAMLSQTKHRQPTGDFHANGRGDLDG